MVITTIIIVLSFVSTSIQGRRRVASERPPAQTLQLDFLTKILPNYHHLLKASRTSTVSSAFASPKVAPK